MERREQTTTFTAGEAIAEGQTVYFSAVNTVSIADAGNLAIGTARAAAASGDLVTVDLWAKPVLGIAAADLALNAFVTTANNGQLAAEATNKTGFICGTDPAAQGDAILVYSVLQEFGAPA